MHWHEMQQIIIYLNKQFSRVLFPYENQGVTNCHELYLSTLLITLSFSYYGMDDGSHGQHPFALCKLVWLSDRS
jgi:hypothetical protein